MVIVLQRVYNYIQNSPLIVAMHPWQKTLSDFSQWEHLDDGDGIESTPKVHRADHKKCRLQFNKMAFDEQSRGAGQQQCSASTVHTRSIHSHPQPTEPTCFFCKEPAGSAGLHEYNIDVNVRRCALELEDTALLTKLAAGDMIAIEAKYHNNCLRSLYNRARQAAPKDDADDSCLHGIAFAELVAFLEDMKNEDSAPVFKLTDIAQLYKV